jgi:hypothetical protein
MGPRGHARLYIVEDFVRLRFAGEGSFEGYPTLAATAASPDISGWLCVRSFPKTIGRQHYCLSGEGSVGQDPMRVSSNWESWGRVPNRIDRI